MGRRLTGFSFWGRKEVEERGRREKTKPVKEGGPRLRLDKDILVENWVTCVRV